MGQQKGNPIPSYQNQAYERLRPNTGIRENRDGGTKPVMIDDNTTINDYIDITFETDVVAAMVSASLNTTIYAVSASIGNNITAVSGSTNTTIFAVSGSTNSTISAVSSSINTTLGVVSSSISSSINLTISVPGTYANDAAAQAAGVRIGGLYHTSGTVKVRLT
jgi:hypothetical protein